MNIIIVGAGKVGAEIAERLSREGHDITVIDRRSERIEALSNSLDVICIEGNGASLETMAQAGVRNADVLIAATGTDEINMVCSVVAKRHGAQHTIARIRDPEYSRQVGFLKEDMALNMAVNPEYAAAMEISRILRFPSAIKVETFSKGQPELVEFKVAPESELAGIPLSKLYGKHHARVLICTVERGDGVYIPNGSFVLREGDRLNIAASPVEMQRFFVSAGAYKRSVKDVMILGGGRIAIYLATALARIGIRVKIVEQDEGRCGLLSDSLPKATIIHGDGIRQEVLREEGLARSDAFVALTGFDEINIITSMYAASCGVGKIVTKVNEDSFVDMLSGSGIESFIQPKRIVAQQILQYVRAMQNASGSSVETLYSLVDGRAEALEFFVRPGARCADTPLRQMRLKSDLLIAALIRGNSCIIPGGNDEIKAGDRAVVVTTRRGLNELDEILAEGGRAAQ